MAVRTRLELATSAVTVRHSNQLNYRTTLDNSITLHLILQQQILIFFKIEKGPFLALRLFSNFKEI